MTWSMWRSFSMEFVLFVDIMVMATAAHCASVWHRHKGWWGFLEKKLSVMLIPGFGFAAVDQTP